MLRPVRLGQSQGPSAALSRGSAAALSPSCLPLRHLLCTSVGTTASHSRGPLVFTKAEGLLLFHDHVLSFLHDGAQQVRVARFLGERVRDLVALPVHRSLALWPASAAAR